MQLHRRIPADDRRPRTREVRFPIPIAGGGLALATTRSAAGRSHCLWPTRFNLSPVPTTPVPTAPASGPTSMHPNCAVPGPDRPPAAKPYPARTTPIPVAWHPIIIRARSDRDAFDSARRGSLTHDCRGRLRRRHIGIDRRRLWRLPVRRRRRNCSRWRLVKGLLSGLRRGLINGLRPVHRHVLDAALHTARGQTH